MPSPDPALLALIAGAIGLIVVGLQLRTAIINRQTANLGLTRARGVPTWERAEPPPSLPDRTPFVNRDDEVREALARVRGGELVLALEGSEGIGKTATATEVAWELRGRRRRTGRRKQTFVWFDCEGRCPHLTSICRSLYRRTGDQSLTAVAEDEKLDALRAHLARRRTVLVLDDLALGDDDASAALRTFLRTLPSGSRVIASMRQPGAIHGSPLPLRELEVPHVLDLLRLFTRRLGLDCADALDEPFALRVRDAVGGNPGMIEWFLRSYRLSSRTLDGLLIAVESGETLPDLEVPTWATASETARLVLCTFACLHGQATAEQLALACDLEEREVSNALDELVRIGAVRPRHAAGEPTLYACSAVLWRFVHAEALPSALDAITARLARHYVERLRSDPENARAVIPHVDAIRALTDELEDRGLDSELQALFRASLDILYTLGLFDDRLAAGWLALRSAERAQDHRAVSLASEVLSGTFALRGELDDAREALAFGFKAVELSGDNGELARQKGCDGFIRYRSRDPLGALQAIEGAEDLARAAGDLETLVNVLIVRTAANWYAGNLDDAEQAAKKCLNVCEEMGWQRAMAYPVRIFAELAIQRHDLDAARELLARGREIAEAYDDRRAQTRVLLVEAHLRLVAGRCWSAASIARRAEADAASLGLPPEGEEARALRAAARRALLLPWERRRYRRDPPHRLSEAPVGGG